MRAISTEKHLSRARGKFTLAMGMLMLWITGLPAAAGTTSTDEQQIQTLILAYTKALTDANPQAVTSLFTPDGIFMPAGLPSAVGQLQIRDAYIHEFSLIKLEVMPVFDEIFRQGDVAYARTRSDGHMTIRAQNRTLSTQHYRAFFILHKHLSQWKIAQLMFNFTDH
jgi:uncharacterized protein (TIGR02246 family)